jgi:hypothetical protein
MPCDPATTRSQRPDFANACVRLVAIMSMDGVFYRSIEAAWSESRLASPAQRRHLERYAQGGVEGFKNTRSEHQLLEWGFIERCDELVRYTETVTWTIYKARITPVGRAYLASECRRNRTHC